MNDTQVIREILKMNKTNDDVNLTALSDLKNVDNPKYLNLEMEITPKMYRKLVGQDVQTSSYKTIK